MKYYKHKDSGEVFAFAEDGTDDAFIDVNLTPMSEDEVAHHIDPPPAPTSGAGLCARIDEAADAARSKVVGDPTRALEYQKAADEAQAFAAAGYPADAVPRTVSAYMLGERTAQQAADNILAEAAAYTEALYQIRETRLQAKELVRQAMEAGETQQAQDIAAETIAAIQAAVAGVGNAQV